MTTNIKKYDDCFSYSFDVLERRIIVVFVKVRGIIFNSLPRVGLS